MGSTTDGESPEPAWRRAALVGLVSLVATFAVGRLLSPDPVIGPEPMLVVSLNAGVVGAFAVLPRRYLPAYLLFVTTITAVVWSIRGGASPAVAGLFSVANLLSVWCYRALALRLGGWDALRFNGRRAITIALGSAVAAVAIGNAVAIAAAVVVPGMPEALAAIPSGDDRGSPGALALLLIRAAAQADGVVTMAPLLSMILTRQFGPSRVPGRTRELAGWALVLIALSGFALALPDAPAYLPLSVVLFAVLLVAVLRHGRQAAAVLTPVFAVAAAATARPTGEFAARMGEFSWTFSSQIYALVIALVSWIVAGVVSERNDAVEALERSLNSRIWHGEARFAAALEAMADPVVMLRGHYDGAGGQDFVVEYANGAARQWGVSAGAPVGARLPAALGQQLRAGLETAFRGHRLFSQDALAVGDGASSRWADVRALRVGDELLLTWRDVSGRVRAANALAASAERFRAALEGMLDPVAIVHPVGASAGAIEDFEATYLNEAARQWGAPDGSRLPAAVSGSARGQQFADYVSAYRTGTPLLQDAVRIPGDSSGDGSGSSGDGQPERYVDLRVTRLEDGLLVSWRDVTARRAGQEELGRRALYDPLTGLGNRHLLRDHLHLALDGLDRDPGTLAVLYLDLDKFKDINDSLGHEAGDLVLREVGSRLAGCLRGTDTAARLAGDEFVAVARARDAPHAAALAERLFLAISEPMTVLGRVLEVRCSLGVTTTTRSDADPDRLLREADLAMYQAKRRGLRPWEVYDTAVHERATRRLSIQHDLAAALQEDRLRLLYQPIVDLGSGRVTGVEALLRIEHPQLGLLLPDSFIDVAEDSDLILPIGTWVLRESCRQLAAWCRGTGTRLHLAVNVSGRQVRHGDLPALVREATAGAGLVPADLTVEITERVLVEAGPGVLADLRELTAGGCGLAIDDFGTGYSSLTYLKAFPVTTVKIDKSFVDGLGRDEEDTAIVTAVTSLARTLKLTVVAEGVESQAQADALRRLGCHRAQGFHLGRPTPPDGVLRLLQRAAARTA